MESMQFYRNAQAIASLASKVDGKEVKAGAIYADLKAYYTEHGKWPDRKLNTTQTQNSESSRPQAE